MEVLESYELEIHRVYRCKPTGWRLWREWLRERDCPWDTSYRSGSRRSPRSTQWARRQGCAWEPTTCAAAAGGGYLEVLRWLRHNGCPWGPDICTAAARSGHLEVLQWARRHGCIWESETCSAAARGGHLEVLQWARQHECPWDEATCEEAARGGHLDASVAHAHGCLGLRHVRLRCIVRQGGSAPVGSATRVP